MGRQGAVETDTSIYPTGITGSIRKHAVRKELHCVDDCSNMNVDQFRRGCLVDQES